jgi:hypothetical protein
MYCPQCGTPNEDSAAFCKSCGAALAKYQQQSSAPDGETAVTEAATGDTGYTADTTAQTDSTTPTPAPYQPQYQPGAYQQPAGQYPPPAYQQGGYAPGYSRPPMPNVPSYLGWAIATLILCFWPTGIVAVVYATKVGNLLSIGDLRGAQDASHNAKVWCWVTFGIAAAIWVISIIIVVAVLVTVGSAIELNY